MAKKPSSGGLKQKLSFQHRTFGDDGYGNEVPGPWVSAFTEYAELMPLRGGEAIMAARLQGTQTFVLRVRSFEASRSVTPEWRAVDARNSERVFNIKSIADAEQNNRWLDMLVEQGVAT